MKATTKNLDYYQYETAKIFITWRGIVQPVGQFKTASQAIGKIVELTENCPGQTELYNIHTPDAILCASNYID